MRALGVCTHCAERVLAKLLGPVRRLFVQDSRLFVQIRSYFFLRHLPQFLPVSVTQATSPPAPVDIQIELRRGAAAMKITWPIAAAAEGAAWMRDLFIESRR